MIFLGVMQRGPGLERRVVGVIGCTFMMKNDEKIRKITKNKEMFRRSTTWASHHSKKKPKSGEERRKYNADYNAKQRLYAQFRDLENQKKKINVLNVQRNRKMLKIRMMLKE